MEKKNTIEIITKEGILRVCADEEYSSITITLQPIGQKSQVELVTVETDEESAVIAKLNESIFFESPESNGTMLFQAY